MSTNYGLKDNQTFITKVNDDGTTSGAIFTKLTDSKTGSDAPCSLKWFVSTDEPKSAYDVVIQGCFYKKVEEDNKVKESKKNLATQIKEGVENLKEQVKKYFEGICAIIQKGSNTSQGKDISDEEGSRHELTSAMTDAKDIANQLFTETTVLPTAERLALNEAYDVMQAVNRLAVVYSLNRGYYYQEYLKDNKKRQTRYAALETAIEKSLDTSLETKYKLAAVDPA